MSASIFPVVPTAFVNPGGVLGAVVNVGMTPAINAALPLGQQLSTGAVVRNFAEDVLKPVENAADWAIRTGVNYFNGEEDDQEKD